MGLIWLRELVNPELMFILCVMWEDSVLVVPLFAVQAYSAVGWMTKESSISFWLAGVFFRLQSEYIFLLFYFVAMDMDQYKFNLDVYSKDSRFGTARLPLDGFS
jgi:hypothetical protein